MKIFKRFLSSLSSVYDDVLNIVRNVAVSVKPEYDKNSLDVITVPKNVETIGEFCFENCRYVNEIILPKRLKKIENNAFFRCKSLKKLKLHDSLTYIGDNAFKGCESLSNISIPNSVKYIGNDCFDMCNSLKSVKLPKFADKICGCWPAQLCYIFKKGDDFYFTDGEKKKGVYVGYQYFVKYVLRHWDDKNLANTLKILNSLHFEIVEVFYENSKKNNDLDFVNEILASNIKKYNWLKSKIIYNVSTMMPFIKLCIILGVFQNSPLKIERTSKSGNKIVETIDYAQKSCEFLIQLIKMGKLDLVIADQINSHLGKVKFNQKLAEFIFNHYDDIIKQGPLFFAECCNKFDEVQKAHTSNKGSCRQLAPTVEFFQKYFTQNKFKGVDGSNFHTASVIGKYYSEQRIFDRANEIIKLHKQNNVPDNILGEDFSEEIFKKIKNRIKNIENISLDTTKSLCDTAQCFSYEMLRKDDVLNLVLGKLCNCCAHLEGVGDGIAVASMLDPSVQNIVIKDKNGEIVAKSTIYVNQKEGYAVCNSFMVSAKVSRDNLNNIYTKFKEAISDFATEYNRKFTPKLKVVTVGMCFNDLHGIIKDNDKKYPKILQPLSYAKYSQKLNAYNGDSLEEQYTVWQDNFIK